MITIGIKGLSGAELYLAAYERFSGYGLPILSSMKTVTYFFKSEDAANRFQFELELHSDII